MAASRHASILRDFSLIKYGGKSNIRFHKCLDWKIETGIDQYFFYRTVLRFARTTSSVCTVSRSVLFPFLRQTMSLVPASISTPTHTPTDTPTYDYLEFQYDSALNQFLEKEDLVSLHVALCALEITLPALRIISLEELNQLCDKLHLEIGSSTRLQFTRAIVKLQAEYKQKRRERRERERQQRELALDIQHSTLNDKKSRSPSLRSSSLRSSSLRSKSPPRLKAFSNSSPLRPILSLGGSRSASNKPNRVSNASPGLSPVSGPVVHSTPITPSKPKHDPKPISLSPSESYTRPLHSPKPRGYDYSIKCILLGDSAVGKSCILVRYFDDAFQCSHGATIGIDYRIKTVELGDDLIKFQIWDTAGQEKYRTIIAAYYRGIDAG